MASSGQVVCNIFEAVCPMPVRVVYEENNSYFETNQGEQRMVTTYLPQVGTPFEPEVTISAPDSANVGDEIEVTLETNIPAVIPVPTETP